jgi:hypothetical protein
LDDVAELSIMEIGIIEQKIVRGGAGRKRKHENVTDTNYKHAKDFRTYCGSFKSIKIIQSDNYCLVRAVLLGKLKCEGKRDWSKMNRSSIAAFENAVRQTAKLLDLPDLKGGLDVSHVETLEKLFSNVQIIVFGEGRRESDPIYWNKDRVDCPHKIYIAHDPLEQHYYLINSVKTYFNSWYFCSYCMKRYHKLGAHKCSYTCKGCQKQDCHVNVDSQETCKCGDTLRNEFCKKRHQETVCYLNKLCEFCNGMLYKNKLHICRDQRYCHSCKSSVDMDHMCYMKTIAQEKKLKKTKDREFRGFLFYDFETTINKDTQNHEVNLAMCQRACADCCELTSRCTKCEPMLTFYDISTFVDFILSKECEHYTMIAHNSKGFDAHFIMNEIDKRRNPSNMPPQPIMVGSKLLGVYFRTIILKDSASFLPLKLSDLGKAFKLKELKKGIFLFVIITHKFLLLTHNLFA